VIFAEEILLTILWISSGDIQGVLYDLMAERKLHQFITIWLGVVMFSSALSAKTTIGMIGKSPTSFSIALTALACAAL
jgi:hypothetical protein